PAEMVRTLNGNHFREAYKDGRSLSSWLEEQMPYVDYKDGMDAFQRLIHLSGIRTNTVREYGIYADRFEVFDKNDATRALALEFMFRQWRAAATGVDPSTRSLYLSGETVPASALNPYVTAARAR